MDGITPTEGAKGYDSTFKNLKESQDEMRHSLDRFHAALRSALQQMKDQQSYADSPSSLPSQSNTSAQAFAQALAQVQALEEGTQAGLPPNSSQFEDDLRLDTSLPVSSLSEELIKLDPAPVPNQALAQELNNVGEASLPEALLHGSDKVSFPEASLPGSDKASLLEALLPAIDKVSLPESSLPSLGGCSKVGSKGFDGVCLDGPFDLPVVEEVDGQQLPATGFINGFTHPDLDRLKNLQAR